MRENIRKKLAQRIFKLALVGAFGTIWDQKQKWGLEDMSKNGDHKSTTPVINMLQNEDPEKWSFGYFRAWSPGQPQGGSLTRKQTEIKAQTLILCIFMLSISTPP